MKSRYLILFFLVLSCSQNDPLQHVLEKGSSRFQKILNDSKHEVQIIYGKILKESIRHYYFNHEPNSYFYPASTVKMPVAFAAMERLYESGLMPDTKLQIDSQQYHPIDLVYDSLFQDSLKVEYLIKKIFVFSDNASYNTIYRWLGKDYLNTVFQNMGLETRIVHLLSEHAFSFEAEANSHAYHYVINGVNKVPEKTTIDQKFVNKLSADGQIKGKGYANGQDSIVYAPFDFSKKNFVPLNTLLGSLERVVKPELFPEEQRFSFSESQRIQLLEMMDLLPQDLPYPIDTLADNYVKFFWKSDQPDVEIPDHLHIYNKVGWAYGYLTDVSYFKDDFNEVEFFLAATIHVNQNEIYNDGIYEYEDIGLPFLSELGMLIYEYELKAVDFIETNQKIL